MVIRLRALFFTPNFFQKAAFGCLSEYADASKIPLEIPKIKVSRFPADI
jgi:hypothetical protein